MIGGEGEENPIWMENGQWIEFAKEYVNKKLSYSIYFNLNYVFLFSLKI
jgi:hypothetical protein